MWVLSSVFSNVSQTLVKWFIYLFLSMQARVTKWQWCHVPRVVDMCFPLVCEYPLLIPGSNSCLKVLLEALSLGKLLSATKQKHSGCMITCILCVSFPPIHTILDRASAGVFICMFVFLFWRRVPDVVCCVQPVCGCWCE